MKRFSMQRSEGSSKRIETNMQFHITPYVGPEPIKFGMSEQEIHSLLGPPVRVRRNYLDETELVYGDFSVRFGKRGEGVVEVGFLPSASVMLEGIDLFRETDAFRKIVVMSTGAYDCGGFIVMPDLGLTFSGFHDIDVNDTDGDRAITVFVKGRWDAELVDCDSFTLRGPRG